MPNNTEEEIGEIKPLIILKYCLRGKTVNKKEANAPAQGNSQYSSEECSLKVIVVEKTAEGLLVVKVRNDILW